MACSVHHTPVLFNNWLISQYLKTFNHIGYAQCLITDINLCKISVVYATQCALYWQCPRTFRTTLVYHINNMSLDRHFPYNIWILFKNNNKISTLIYLQNNTDVKSRYGCNGNTHVNHVDPVYVHRFTCLFIDR